MVDVSPRPHTSVHTQKIRKLLFDWSKKMAQLRKWMTKGSRHVLSFWKEEELVKQVMATHVSNDLDFHVDPVLYGVHRIFQYANPSLLVLQQHPFNQLSCLLFVCSPSNNFTHEQTAYIVYMPVH